ncbi:uncharacterized protein LOC126901279 [Daktulosphaira vitifoliae]|uniref:uncharacterized protein LOC126901279 n=1 Tax=Daktulosphaira vitifoliae TaxID=58002 RepID=UPI0021AB04C1|nr:uncharacterized protein LOC126901279 [Daktulosphaira vitifoliae]
MANRIEKFKKELEAFIEKHPEPVQCNDFFMDAVKLINYGLLSFELSYSRLSVDSAIFTILNCASSIMLYIQKADLLQPLNEKAFIVYMELSCTISRLKSVILSELVYVKEIEDKSIQDISKEQYLCESFKSKFETFENNLTEKDVQPIKEAFSLFLIEYIKFLSKLSENKILKKNIKLLLEVADYNLLLNNLHNYCHLIPSSKKVVFLQKLINFSIENHFSLEDCKFIVDLNKDYKLEACIMTYYTLKNYCEHFTNKKMNQTSSIFAKLNLDNIISLLESEMPDSTVDDICFEAVELFIFKKYDKVSPISSYEIKNYVNILQSLHDIYSDHQFRNYRCSFTIVILSMIYELVLNTDLKKSVIISLMNLLIDYLKTCKLPSNFKAANYTLIIYQKIKSDHEMEALVKLLCKVLSESMGLHKLDYNISNDLMEVFDNNNDLIDKCFIVSHFLCNINDTNAKKDKNVNALLQKLNESIIFNSNESLTCQLILPYSLSLHFSITTKNEDFIYNNFAVLEKYIDILFDKNQLSHMDDKKYLTSKLLKHYNEISNCLPKSFLINCWKNVLYPDTLGLNIAKTLLQMCSAKVLNEFIEILKTETLKTIEKDKSSEKNYYLFIYQLWSCLLNMQYLNKKRKIRRDSVNHFGFILNKYYMFNLKKKHTNQGFILLMKILSLMLKVQWVNKPIIINSSLRVITLVEQNSSLNEEVLTEITELLIVLYKCSNNAIKPYLSLYMITFANIVKRCWLYLMEKSDINSKNDKYLLKPFHKLDKCSSLFKINKSDFSDTIQYIIGHLIELLTLHKHLPQGFMRYYYNIIFNLMDVCGRLEMAQLLATVKGPCLMVLSRTYEDYRSNVRFIGRL